MEDIYVDSHWRNDRSAIAIYRIIYDSDITNSPGIRISDMGNKALN